MMKPQQRPREPNIFDDQSLAGLRRHHHHNKSPLLQENPHEGVCYYRAIKESRLNNKVENIPFLNALSNNNNRIVGFEEQKQEDSKLCDHSRPRDIVRLLPQKQPHLMVM